MKTSLIAIIAVVVIVAVGLTFVFFGGAPGAPSTSTTTTSTSSSTSIPSKSSTTTSQTQGTPPPGLRAAFDTHLGKLTARDIPSVLNDYQGTAVVQWTGSAGGLEGTYSGTGNIRLLYSAALSTAQQFSVAPASYVQANKSSTQVVVNSTLSLKGSSNILGPFNGTVSASITYVYSNGGWLISSENWHYVNLNIASGGGGATTFPEWQKVGPIIPARRSTDWLHNFAWDYGGPGVAVIIMAFAVLIAVAVVVKRVWKPST